MSTHRPASRTRLLLIRNPTWDPEWRHFPWKLPWFFDSSTSAWGQFRNLQEGVCAGDGDQRGKVAVCALVWLGIVLWRHTELNWIAVAAQAVFCEQILSRFFRFERLKSECERIYEDQYKLLQSKRLVDVFAQEGAGRYEIWKAVASLPTSPTLFDQHNERLNEEWNMIRAALKI